MPEPVRAPRKEGQGMMKCCPTQSTFNTEGLVCLVGISPSVTDQAYRQRNLIKRWFCGLPGSLQLIVLLYYYDDTSRERIAKLLHISAARVGQLLLRALDSLDQRLSAAQLPVSNVQLPRLINESLEELIQSSVIRPESIEKIRLLWT